MRSRFSLLVASALALSSWSTASAQCTQWGPGLGVTGADGKVEASIVFDDGSGPALYIGGSFENVNGTPAPGVARWDGTSWSPVGLGFNGTVLCFEIFDDGSGPALIAGGSFFSNGIAGADIAHWNGTFWERLVEPSPFLWTSVNDLMAWDDGGGEKLYLAGSNTKRNQNVSVWDGTVLQEIGPSNLTIRSIELFDDGGGLELYAATTSTVRKWIGGTSWSVLPDSPDDVYELFTYDDGSGTALYAGGLFTNAGPLAASHIARWDGSAWSTVGAGVGGNVFTLGVHDDGLGTALLAGGAALYAWDGTSWSTTPADGTVSSLGEFDEGSGTSLFVGGAFSTIGGVFVHSIGRWDGFDWSALGTGTGMDDRVVAMEVLDVGGSEDLYVAGRFDYAGTKPAFGITRWTGSNWVTLGSGLAGWGLSLASFDDGSGPAMYVGGTFTEAGGLPADHIAKWDGSSWSAVGAGHNGQVRALAVYDDGTGEALFAGGSFSTGIPRIARWDGTQWTAVGGGLNGAVYSLLVWDDGSGAALYAGGQFTQAGGQPAPGIARWDGITWAPVGLGISGTVKALATFDAGSGEELYAGGGFLATASGVPAFRIARFDGTSWQQAGAKGFNKEVRSLQVFDDGSGAGRMLYAGGDFETLEGGLVVNQIARYDGAAWSAIDSGADNSVLAMEVYDDGTGNGPTLWLGGSFDLTGGIQAAKIGRYSNPCFVPYVNYCTAGISASGCTALISASGIPSATAATGFDLSVAGVEGNKIGIFTWGSNGRQANPWGNGTSLICVVPPRKRSAVIGPAGTNGTCDGNYTYDMTARWTQKPAQNPGQGATVQMQFWHRDPANTSNQNSSLSNAMEFVTTP